MSGMKFTMLARALDGLPLVASMEDEQGTSNDLSKFKNQAKLLFRKLSEASPTRASIETDDAYIFHYIIEVGVCYLVLCDRAYPKKLAFSYLNELQHEFDTEHGRDVGVAARPYAFIRFETFVQKTKRNYEDTRATRNMAKLNEDLQDVTRIMTQNITEVLGRGEKLDKVSALAGNLSAESKKYASQAKYMNIQAMYRKYGPIAIFVLVITSVLYLRFFWF